MLKVGLHNHLFEKALKLKPDYTEAATNLNTARHALAEAGQVITRLKQARQQRPDDPQITLQLATVCLEAGMEELAIDLFEQTLFLEPECEICLDSLTRIFITTGRYDRAAQMLEQLVLLYPDNPNFSYSLACAYARSGQKEKSVGNLKKAVTNGLTDIDYIRSDENLKSIRDTEYFKSLTGGGND